MQGIIAKRRHRILAGRKDQLVLNVLALHGGRAYVDARLWRAPNESEASWTGNRPFAASGCTGRRNRAAVVNDAGRVAAKINQYLFSREIERAGIDPAFEADCTGTGKSIADFWLDVSETLTACQWLWVQADRCAAAVDPETGRPVQRTLAQRQALGDRVRLSLWLPWEVADWCFDSTGALLWLQLLQTLDPEHLIFIDESGAKTNMTRLRGWAYGGERLFAHAPHGHGCTTTLIGAVWLDGSTAVMELPGAMNGAAFRACVEYVLSPKLRPGDVVVMDDLSTLLDPQARVIIENCGARVLFLAPYSPDFNPIEKMWSKVKTTLRGLAARTQELLSDAITEAISRVTSLDTEGWFRSCQARTFQ